MKIISLQQDWQLILEDKTSLDISLPGSLYSGLLEHHKIENPYIGENEYAACELSMQDCVFQKTFSVCDDLLDSDELMLVFYGVDTLAKIYLNNKLLGECNNMHRTYRFDVKSVLCSGENTITVCFSSPLRYALEQNDREPLWGCPPEECIPGYQHIRKCHSMFGWDWGPKLPDMGLFRPCELWACNVGRLEDLYVRQEHHNGTVTLTAAVNGKIWKQDDLTLQVNLKRNGMLLQSKTLPFSEEQMVQFEITNPELWWPHGYGEQPLYQVEARLLRGGEMIHTMTRRIGLRTLTVSRKPDQWGEEFCFVVNGKKIFSMGGDYVPEDSILAFTNPGRTRRLLEDCVKANFNTIRVWGGGYYPEDWFYDFCDELGLIVWQDFMFACAVYDLTDAFRENITREFEDNLIRLRNHPSLGLLCGNNEMEWGWMVWHLPPSEKLRQDYIEQNERLIPELCRKYAPDTFYWPSSPSSGGGFDDPNSDNRGDVHYWEVWHSNKPFEEYRNHYFRFCSEFGFESFPDLKTIESFAAPKDRNIFSPVMESHQKRQGCNSKILSYITQHYRYPKNLDMIVYASQLIQADAMRYGVEHWRRFRGRCMGAIYWQLNDCWPVASWSSIDYYGRWKALHYYARRFFAPIMLSLHGNGNDCVVSVANETLNDFRGQVICQVKDTAGNCLLEQTAEVTLHSLSSQDVHQIDLSGVIQNVAQQRERYLFVTLVDENGTRIQSTSYTVCRSKHFAFQKPVFSVTASENDTQIQLSIMSSTFARSVRLLSGAGDIIFSDNYFDMTDGVCHTVTVDRNQIPAEMSAQAFADTLSLVSVYDIAQGE